MNTNTSMPTASSQPVLIEIPGAPEGPPPSVTPAPRPRLRPIVRNQIEMRMESLDQRLSPDHPVRAIWDYVEQLDLSAFYAKIGAVEGHRGRDATDPRVLVSLWSYATIEGVGSARKLDHLCRNHRAYEWLTGGASLNYHTLSDFRVAHAEALDDLLTHSVATLMHQELVTLRRVAQDGMRVRASAGKSSFRRQQTLQHCLQEAEGQVQTLKKQIDEDPGKQTRHQKAARQRAARERVQRVQQALQEGQELAKQREQQQREKGVPYDPEKLRTSTTDPEARTMKMPDGGYRPAYNVQFATTTGSQVIVGVDVTNSGSDAGEMHPMVEQIKERYGQVPDEYLADGGFSTKEDIEKVSVPPDGSPETKVYTPVKDAAKKQAAGIDPFAPRTGRKPDSPAMAEWRQRMGTEEAKEIYKERAATAECANAQARNRGLHQFRVRGLMKVRMIAQWYAIAHNLVRALALRASRELVVAGTT